ncbi:MAG: dephospho-CoA kinase [Maricaulis sp.]|jgi:dephospho-CoA kinase|uniref:dephospho-CoA kinase n=1 Tax=Maricaulis sp. TaxID=1486257 RepID=UPI001B2EE035|nr:dephospho-CoA kinase [Maricaulis sp.]MBO6730165.1 dephospho-CoA kinase [Maricaulis sp.]MBO6846232.1 dephospho-CoA kinase [Maricaulis sp.]MBO6875891.1 dephospho-CoA kinase [Maricaulis sp.]MDM7985628.1 dephospho-CoA kinase [Maricaulis sp.]
MIRIGLTGSIGMGKSATAALFAEQGVAVFDSDAAVHELYAKGGAAIGPVSEAFGDVLSDGAIDRGELSAVLREDPAGFGKLEAIVHPLVEAARAAFVAEAREQEIDIVLFDIPLLFETGGEAAVDVVVVCHAPDTVRRARVLERPGMTEEKLDLILARQMPESEKLKRADYAVETSKGLESARKQVRDILADIRQHKTRGEKG